EVPPHLAVIEDVDRFSSQNRLRKEEERHVGPTPRTIDSEEPKPCARNAIEMRIGMGHQFIGLLGGGIHRDRMIHVVTYRERHPRMPTIDRTGGGIDQMLHARVAAALQDIEEFKSV